MTPLCELAKKYQTDKGGAHSMYNGAPNAGTHGYTEVYWELLKDSTLDVRSVLEIGVNSGASLRMWRDFFPFAMIFGLDIDTNYLFAEKGIHCYHVDASDPAALQEVLKRTGRSSFDLIVDDGSHDPNHQRIAIRELCPRLSPRGTMIVEDINVPIEEVAAVVPSGFCHEVRMSRGGSGKYAHAEPLLIIRREPSE